MKSHVACCFKGTNIITTAEPFKKGEDVFVLENQSFRRIGKCEYTLEVYEDYLHGRASFTAGYSSIKLYDGMKFKNRVQMQTGNGMRKYGVRLSSSECTPNDRVMVCSETGRPEFGIVDVANFTDVNMGMYDVCVLRNAVLNSPLIGRENNRGLMVTSVPANGSTVLKVFGMISGKTVNGYSIVYPLHRTLKTIYGRRDFSEFASDTLYESGYFGD